MTTPRTATRTWSRVGVTALALEAALLVLAGALRLYRLDGQLWLDEISALLHAYRRPLWSILTQFPGFIPDPLYDALAHLSLRLFGDTPVAIRLPAALFGIAGVVAFYRLARRIVGGGEALLAGALVAVSFHHIFFSQNARGYTAVLFFSLVATHLALTLRERIRARTAAAYAGAAALAGYAHPFGVFVPAGQLLVLALATWRRPPAEEGPRRTAPYLAILGLVTYLLIVILYAPFLRDTIAFSITTGRSAGQGVGLAGVVQEILAALRATGGWAGVAVACFVGAFGALDLLFRRPLPVALMVMPIMLSAAAVAILGVGVQPRYFLFLLPLGYLAATRGLVLVARAALNRVSSSAKRLRKLEVGLAVAVVAVAAVPLLRYYAVPKQDFQGALRLTLSLAAPGDRVVAATYAGHAIRSYYDPAIEVVEDVAQLEEAEAKAPRVWVITTLERVMTRATPALLERLHGRYRLVRTLPGTLGDGTMRIYVWESEQRSGSSRP